jgi:ribonuclease BN (tRNA processing enzyme)
MIQALVQIVMLGTGTPNADPARSGPAVAVVVNGTPYLVDAGPGVVRRAAAARIPAESLRTVFITHLHSDHTLGLPDLMLSPWTLERTVPLQVYGPPGVAAMTRHILEAYQQDIDIRLTGGEPSNPTGWKAEGHEVRPGTVYRDSNVTVTAFSVPHGAWPDAYGYRFVTRDRVIVISGDTGPAPDVIARECNECDVLVHEVYSTAGFARRPPEWQRYHARYHTSTGELAAIAVKARPKLLVLYHQLFWGTSDEDLVKEVLRGYNGRVVSAKDLDVF